MSSTLPGTRGADGRYVVGSQRHDLPVLERYEVDADTGCWNWLGNIDRAHGYGRCKFEGSTTVVAHRVLYENLVGPIPEGLQLDHLCRNRRCVNPDHLEPVTRAENVRRGSATKLTEADVHEIHRVMDEMCDRYGVVPGTLSQIAARKIWKDV